MEIRFHEQCEKAAAEIGSGLYRRTFTADEQPFEVTESEWRVLREIRDVWTDTRGAEPITRRGPLFVVSTPDAELMTQEN